MTPSRHPTKDAARLVRRSVGRAAVAATATAAVLASLPLALAASPAPGQARLAGLSARADVRAAAPPGRLAAAPAGRVSQVPDLACSLASGLRLCTHGDDGQLRHGVTAGAEGGGQQASTTSTRVGCYGDGRSGPRIQAVYARPATATDRFATMLPSFRGWAGALEKAIDDSAHQTRGARHVRFATRPSGSSCVLDVLSVALPGNAFASFSATVNALQQQGLDAKGMKYLVWSDATGYCGIASMYDDGTAGADNRNNGVFPTYARVDRKCWGYAETHEVVHMLGGVQKGAPHATAGWHCRDGNDVMCYDDGTAGSRQVATCSTSQAALLDCRHDDYFSTSPAAGSWLAKHWNIAGSAFLSPDWTSPAPAPAPQAEDQPTPPEQPAPSPSATSLLPPLPTLPPLPHGLLP